MIGIFVGSASAGFLHSLTWATKLRESNLWIISFLPLGGLGIGLLYHYYGENIEGGNNILIKTIYRPKRYIPFKMAPFIYLGTMVTHILGGSAGREGTALQMAGALAYQLVKPFKLSPNEIKMLIITAIAAGFGSVFGSPFAGAVFGLEVAFVGRLKCEAIFPAFLSAIIANLVCELWQVNHAHYIINTIPNITFTNILYCIIAGLLFGLCALTFSKSTHWATSLFKLIISYAPLRPFIGGLIVVLAVYLIGNTTFIGLGLTTISQAFEQSLPAHYFLLKMAFTIITLAAGFKGGEVTPLFFIGATLGSALFYFIPLPLGLLAGMGFVAVFAAATNTPLACTVLALELFGFQSIIYMVIACVVSYLVSGKSTIYSAQKSRGVNLKYFRFLP